jgi:hypothetical protein
LSFWRRFIGGKLCNPVLSTRQDVPMQHPLDRRQPAPRSAFVFVRILVDADPDSFVMHRTVSLRQ